MVDKMVSLKNYCAKTLKHFLENGERIVIVIGFTETVCSLLQVYIIKVAKLSPSSQIASKIKRTFRK